MQTSKDESGKQQEGTPPERKIEYFQEQEAPLYVHNRISQPTSNQKQTYPE